MKKIIIPAIALVLVGACVFQYYRTVPTLSKYGSRGNEVISIQTKLKQLGFLQGNVDGIYGSQTQAAVRNYQKSRGLQVDGIAGPQTLKSLGITSGYSNNDIQLLARAVYAEARGEPYRGQVAVAAVILNRVKSPSFPNSISGVIYQPGAFSSYSEIFFSSSSGSAPASASSSYSSE